MYETKTDQLAEVIEQEYKNPFGKDVDKEKLVNISSGVALDDDIGESILNMVNVGKEEWKILDRNDSFPKKYHFMHR